MIDSRLKRHELGFLQIANMPTALELEEYYSLVYFQEGKGSYSPVYSPLETDVRELQQDRLVEKALSLRDSAFPLGGRFLDVGCGEGFLLADMASRGWEVRGLDFSHAGVTAMNPEVAQFVDLGDTFNLLDAAITSGESYDLVWSFHVLEHVTNPVGLMERLRRVLSPGGTLVVSVPNDGNVFHEQLLKDGFIQHRWWIAPPDHLSYFTRESLENIAEHCGFIVKSVEGSFPIDWYLAHPGSNYVDNPEKGAQAHSARCMLELAIEKSGKQEAGFFYESLARTGLGRDLVAFLA